MGLESILEDIRVVSAPFGSAVTALPHASADTVRGCSDHFVRAGGDLTEVLDMLNGVFRYNGRSETLHYADLSDGVDMSPTAYFLFDAAMKMVIGDWSYHFDSDQELLSADHKIFELGPLDGSPMVNKNRPGDAKGISGKNFRTAISVFRDVVADQVSREHSGSDKSKAEMSVLISEEVDLQTKNLIELVNTFVADPTQHVSLQELTDPNHWYTPRFTQNFYEMVKVVSGKPDILADIGKRNIPDIVKLLATALPVEKGYRTMPQFAAKFNDVLEIRTLDVGNGYAVIEIGSTDELRAEMGKYIQQARMNSCILAGETMGSVASRIYGLDVKPSVELACSVKNVGEVDAKALPFFMQRRSPLLHDGSVHSADKCVYLYQWRYVSTGWEKFFDVTGGGHPTVLPRFSDFRDDFAGSLGRLGTLLLSALLFPVGLYVAHKRLVKQQNDIASLTEAVEDLIDDREEFATRRVEQKVAEITKLNAALYSLGDAYSRYKRFTDEGNRAGAKQAFKSLQQIATEYFRSSVLQDRQDIGLEELRRRVKGASLFLTLGETMGGVTADPLQGWGTSLVFRTGGKGLEDVAKRFDLRERADAEEVFYRWVGEQDPRLRSHFPTPEVWAYIDLAHRREGTENLESMQLLVMQNIQGPTIYDFFDMLNKGRTADNVGGVDLLKRSFVESLIDKYLFISSEVQKREDGSLGANLAELRQRQTPAPVDYAGKMFEVVDFLAGDETDDRILFNLEHCVQVLEQELTKIKHVPFFDLSAFNASVESRDLYSHMLMTYDDLPLERARERSFSMRAEDLENEMFERVMSLLEEGALDGDGVRELGRLCADSVKFYDYEKLGLDTADYDDFTHLITFPSFDVPVETREALKEDYLSTRFGSDGALREQGRLEMDIVSLYRSFRWIRVFGKAEGERWEDPGFKRSNVDFMVSAGICDIDDWLRAQGVSGPDRKIEDMDLYVPTDVLREQGVVGAMEYMRSYLLSLDMGAIQVDR